MLIRRAELADGAVADVRLAHGHVAAIGALPRDGDEPVLDARGARLLPGLHDHHIHLFALAAASSSVACGPPDVADAASLAARLRAAPGAGWLRGTGYHESVAGMLDAAMLDRMVSDRPVRVQHRSGRMWFLNTAALDAVLARGAAPPPGLERAGGRFTGRLFDADAWLRAALGGTPPDLADVGARLVRAGVTGLTDMSPANDAASARHFAAEIARGALPQRVLLAGTLGLDDGDMRAGLRLGAVKLHLHEADLPPLDAATDLIRAAHAVGRPAAIHCATEVELVFALGALSDAGAMPGDRIEHASIAPDWTVAEIAERGLAVVTQPHFIAERGDAYRADVAPEDLPHLYRLRAFRDAGATLAGGSDAPFGRPDPWAAMAAAVSRRTPAGATIGADEALTPEAALDLFLRDPEALDRRREVRVGVPADLCLLDRPWRAARATLSTDLVRATIVGGRIVHERVDETPAERRRGADAPP